MSTTLYSLFYFSLQLNEVYSSAEELKRWYKKVRIDSFSKGSVLVDYYVELSNISKSVDTLEIKELFHQALVPKTPSATDRINSRPDSENETETESGEENSSDRELEEKPELVKGAAFQMGKFVIDPVATDFSGSSLC